MTVRELMTQLQTHIDRDPKTLDLAPCIDEVPNGIGIVPNPMSICFEIARNVYLSVVR